MGYALWRRERPFGPHYLGQLLREEWAAKLGSAVLLRQARFFRENPDKNLDDLRPETQARLEALRAREAKKRELKAREREGRRGPRPNGNGRRKSSASVESENEGRRRNGKCVNATPGRSGGSSTSYERLGSQRLLTGALSGWAAPLSR
jgi:hypothetical protein